MAEAPPGPSVGYYAQLVRENQTRRDIERAGQRITQAAAGGELSDVLDYVGSIAVGLVQAVHTPLDDSPVAGLVEVGEFVDAAVEPYEWLVPGLLERMDRVVVVAGEGSGKSTLARQVAVCVSQGRHPFQPSQLIEPRRTLLVDLENPPSLIRRKYRSLVDACRAYEEWQPRSFIWSRPGGLDLRKPSDAAELERAIIQTRADLVCFGPVYKAFTLKGDSTNLAAGEAAAVLDGIRERRRVAWWIETHAPMEQQGRRDMRPVDAGYWLRWPEFGLSLVKDPKDKGALVVKRFRGDRDERAWPVRLQRSLPWPWEGVYEDGAWT
jgi:replicative DNA helicase